MFESKSTTELKTIVANYGRSIQPLPAGVLEFAPKDVRDASERYQGATEVRIARAHELAEAQAALEAAGLSEAEAAVAATEKGKTPPKSESEPLEDAVKEAERTLHAALLVELKRMRDYNEAVALARDSWRSELEDRGKHAATEMIDAVDAVRTLAIKRDQILAVEKSIENARINAASWPRFSNAAVRLPNRIEARLDKLLADLMCETHGIDSTKRIRANRNEDWDALRAGDIKRKDAPISMRPRREA